MSMDKRFVNLWVQRVEGSTPRYLFSRVYHSTEVSEMIEGRRDIPPGLGWTLVGSFLITGTSIRPMDGLKEEDEVNGKAYRLNLKRAYGVDGYRVFHAQNDQDAERHVGILGAPGLEVYVLGDWKTMYASEPLEKKPDKSARPWP